MSDKVCSTCEVKLRFEAFYKERRSKDGRTARCIECTKIAVSYYRLNNADRLRSYERARNQTAKRKKYFKELSKTKRRKDRQAESKRNYLDRNPIKVQAHKMVRAAKVLGILRPRECEACGSGERINAHHDDYSKPLKVRWLCHICHKRWHTENGPGKNG